MKDLVVLKVLEGTATPEEIRLASVICKVSSICARLEQMSSQRYNIPQFKRKEEELCKELVKTIIQEKYATTAFYDAIMKILLDEFENGEEQQEQITSTAGRIYELVNGELKHD